MYLIRKRGLYLLYWPCSRKNEWAASYSLNMVPSIICHLFQVDNNNKLSNRHQRNGCWFNQLINKAMGEKFTKSWVIKNLLALKSLLAFTPPPRRNPCSEERTTKRLPTNGGRHRCCQWTEGSPPSPAGRHHTVRYPAEDFESDRQHVVRMQLVRAHLYGHVLGFHLTPPLSDFDTLI